MTSWIYFRNLAGEVAEIYLEMIQRENSQLMEAWWEMAILVIEGMFH